MAPTRAGTHGAKKKRGRPSNASKVAAIRSSQTSKRGPKSSMAKQKPKRKSSSESRAGRPPKSAAAPKAQPSTGRKRQVQEAEIENSSFEGQATQKYARLVPRTRRITQETVAKWKNPSQLVQDQIREVLAFAKLEVSQTRGSDERKREVAEETLRMLVRKLENRLSNMVLPPQAKDLHFNLNRLAERNKSLEAQIVPALDLIKVLEEQVRTAQSGLDADVKNLGRLKADLESLRGMHNTQKKKAKLHPLLKLPKGFEIEGDGPEDIGLKTSAPVDMSSLEAPDPELAPLLGQLRRSLESMQANHAQVQGIDETMKDAEMALDDVLFKHASAQQYDSLMNY
ncbi:hypothetical protein K469DRAFT_393028 [Zopfia rhizophila CBS 207.26]|uniref:CENP-Q, a CENPA-CAD centromere complex subunit-domain-containing protein n=1 Tax=Zopfia rhizophila CBS 207.26 TaxID=1314779 RepID=A0A6A6EL35_9PEZI|nr:hypothetical protein K469DRAFT_393028 [Zopfia rhizophila CBS 207.26]